MFDLQTENTENLEKQISDDIWYPVKIILFTLFIQAFFQVCAPDFEF